MSLGNASILFEIMSFLLSKQNSSKLSWRNFPLILALFQSMIFMKLHLNSVFCLHPLITFASLSSLLLSKCNLNASHKSQLKLSSKISFPNISSKIWREIAVSLDQIGNPSTSYQNDHNFLSLKIKFMFSFSGLMIWTITS